MHPRNKSARHDDGDFPPQMIFPWTRPGIEGAEIRIGTTGRGFWHQQTQAGRGGLQISIGVREPSGKPTRIARAQNRINALSALRSPLPINGNDVELAGAIRAPAHSSTIFSRERKWPVAGVPPVADRKTLVIHRQDYWPGLNDAFAVNDSKRKIPG